MKFQLKGTITLSKNAADNKDEILEIIHQVEDELKSKEKQFDNYDYQSKYKLKNEKQIVAELKMKEHPVAMFFYRIRKNLAGKIGKKLRIGIKALTIDSLKVEFDIDKLPRDPITIPYATELKFEDASESGSKTDSKKGSKADSEKGSKKCTFILENVPEKFITKSYIPRMVRRIKEKVDRTYYEGKAEYHNVLYSSPKRDITFDKDPTKVMMELDWVAPASTKGKWIYWAPATALFKTMEKIIREELLAPLKFQEIINSNVISGEDVWLRTGHLEGMPMELYYVLEPVTRDVKEWETFVDLLKITKEVPYDELVKMLQYKPIKGLTYAQCPPIYWALKGKTIAEESFPLLIFEGKANSFRYESGGRHGIERVDEFHRIEVVYIGSPEELLALRDKLLERYKHIFNEILEIEWRLANVTPFYMQQAGDVFKEGMVAGDLGTLDFEAWLPYRGSRDESEWLEFQNLSIVGDKYVKAFTIKHQRNAELWSGCTGIGLERWVAVFLAQHGFDRSKWPDSFKKYLVDIPEPIKFY